MMKKAIFAASVALAAAIGSAQALEKPDLSNLDQRVMYTEFKPGQVYPILAANGVISTIVFAPGEKILDYGSGYSSAWEFAGRGNHFFLKPKDFNGTTNLVVVTDRHTYHFEIRLIPNRQKATFSLTFRYPVEEAQKAQAEAEKKVVDGLLDQSDTPKSAEESSSENSLNRLYTENFGATELSKDIAPLEVYDNGLFTFLKFAGQTDFPAVYRVADDQSETLLNSHVKDGWLVVHGVYKELRLRAGLSVVGIYNEAYTGGGRAASSGVTVPGVKRELVKEVN